MQEQTILKNAFKNDTPDEDWYPGSVMGHRQLLQKKAEHLQTVRKANTPLDKDP